MAIAGYKVTAPLPTQPNLPKVEPENYKSVIYDDKNKPLHSLIAYIEGAPWTVDFYSQIVSEHNDLREVDPGQPNVYQQYQKIKGLELRVNSALSSSYDSATGITTVTGNGLVYPFMVPNVSDYFVTDTADNRKALFKITQVDRKTFNRDSAYAVEYTLVGYIETILDLFNDLESKVTKTFHFSKQRLVEGLQPTLKTEEYEQVTSLRHHYVDLVNYYFRTFFNRKYMTLVLPGQTFSVYDSFLVNYLLKIVDTLDAPDIRNVKKIPTDKDPYLSQPQFWDLMLNRDYDSRLTCNKQMNLVSKHRFNKNSFIEGLAFSNIDYVVYPVTADLTVNINESPSIHAGAEEEVIEVKNVSGTLADLIVHQYVTETRTFQHIYTVMHDDNYVLSQNFYDNTANQSLLEVLVKDYLKGQTLDLNQLLSLLGKYKTYGRLEQFYYGPILLTLIKEADRGSYS